jgi:hypothetical protein
MTQQESRPKAEGTGSVRVPGLTLRQLRAANHFSDGDYVEQQAEWDGIGEDEPVWHFERIRLVDIEHWSNFGFEDNETDYIDSMVQAYREGSFPPPIIVVRRPPKALSDGTMITLSPLDGAHRSTAARMAGLDEITAWVADLTPPPS